MNITESGAEIDEYSENVSTDEFSIVMTVR